MNITNRIETGATRRVPKMKMRQIRESIIMWPAIMFANNLIIRANGFEIIPISSTGIIIGRSQNGTPGVANICLQ